MIGIFDSGSGGISVLRAIRTHAPKADLLYFGDLIHAPYGNRSREELNTLTEKGIRLLLDHGATEIVSACNSVTVSTKSSCKACHVPYQRLIEMVGPTVKSLSTVKGDILVLATRATVESEIYQRAFLSVNINAIGLPIPDLVTLIEHGGSRDAMFAMIQQALIPQKEQRYSHIILGCTHFPLVRDVFEEVLASLCMYAELVDPAEAVAQAVTTRFDTAGKGSMRLLTSAKSLTFESFVHTLFPGETHIVKVL